MKTTILDTLQSFNRNLRSPINNASWQRALVLVALFLGCFALLPGAQGQLTPPPDGCYPNFTTAEGCDALNSLTTGSGNTAIGWFSLFSTTDASFNTGVGGGALALNNGDSNTAVGAAALLLNTSGTENTAVGTDTLLNNGTGTENTAHGASALFSNIEGIRNTAIGSHTLEDNAANSNTAVGADALGANTTGTFNVSVGGSALIDNTEGSDNTAVGVGALNLNATGNGHTVVGRLAGAGLDSVDNNVIVGQLSGVHSVFGQISDRCFIANIFGAPVDGTDFAPVLVDSNGRLGTFTVAAGETDPGGFYPHGAPRQAIPQGAKEAVLNRKGDAVEAIVAELRDQLKEQAAQIQKVSAQLEVNKPAPKVVVNKP